MRRLSIYGDENWLIANRGPAVEYLIDGYQKLRTALSLEYEILQMMNSMTAEVPSFSLNRIIYIISIYLILS